MWNPYFFEEKYTKIGKCVYLWEETDMKGVKKVTTWFKDYYNRKRSHQAGHYTMMDISTKLWYELMKICG